MLGALPVPSSPGFRRRLAAVAAVWCAGIVLSVLLLDRATVVYCATQPWSLPLYHATKDIPPLAFRLLMAGLVTAAVAVFAARGQRASSAIAILLSTGCGLALTELILKPLFGRPDIVTSFGQSDFAFHFFRSGDDYRAFPSGHATLIAASLGVVFWCYPRSRPVIAATIAALSLGLVLLKRHFLGDVLAGDLVGLLAAYGVAVGWSFVAMQRVPDASTVSGPALTPSREESSA